ncbi:acetylornithine deacetylase [Falsirhodobacter xinxiangensis]|uniref:acetylornithine deacetylase n=1 Tax=Falsirhodobacter xinxiangensis TaxID=2530049 RepID=UPI0010AB491D|nr:acetylornithine deacetylase [Rhodobacter xinxiangensis]
MQLSPREILEKLVSFPTVSRDSNLPLIDWVEEYLDSHGIPAHRVWNEARTKASLFAHVGPEAEGGVILSGHSDVVPVEGQDWTSDPWVVTERDGKLYGRGCADMKGFVALSLWAMAEAQKQGVKRPLQLALSHDEELGCIAAPDMIAEIVRSLPRASAVIVGEPSRMRLVNGHKGSTGFKVHVRGHEVHSSMLHTGVNAIMLGAKLIDWANRVNAQNARQPATELSGLFTPHWTTLHVGTITGGTAENITARDCRFGFGFRVVPGESSQDWLSRLRAEAARLEAEAQAIHPDAAITLDRSFVVPPLQPEQDGAAERLVRAITGDNASGVVSYGTEAGQFQEAGFSTVVCGPGDIAQAHQADEFIEVAQFESGAAFMRDLVARLRSDHGDVPEK